MATSTVTNKMLSLFAELGEPYLQAFPDEIFQTNKTLDAITKLKNFKDGKKMARTKGRGDIIQLASAFETISGRKIEIDYDTSVFLTEDQITNGSLYIQDRDKRVSHEGGSAAKGVHFMADVGLSMSVPKKEMQRWEELYKSRKMMAMRLKWTEKWKGFLQRFAIFIAREWYYGKGSIDVEDGFDPFNSRVVDTYGLVKPTKNQLEGIMYYMFDNPFSYGGLNNTTYPYFAPYTYDFSAAGTTSVFGYDTTSEFDSRSTLISATNSMTANVPIILDMISQVITDMNSGTDKKVELIVVSKNLYNLIKDAKKSKLYSASYGGDGKYLEDLMEAGIKGALVIDDVAILMDDTAIKSPGSKTGTYIFPENKLLFYKNLDAFKFYQNSIDKFESKGFNPVPNVWGEFETHVSGTIGSVNTYRAGQGVMTLPTVDYSA